ncbi:hypothetical protein OIU78_006612, partial [Salix suchowensis]
MALQECL